MFLCTPAFADEMQEAQPAGFGTPKSVTAAAAAADKIQLPSERREEKVPVDSVANTALPVYITADTLSYIDGTGEIKAKENVILRHDDAVIFADDIYINTKTGDVYARGNVLALQNDSKIYTDSLEYNTNSKTAKCVNADIMSAPWRGACSLVESFEKKHSLKDPVITTCGMETPHYRIAASAINFYVNDRVEVFNAVIYIGAIPVLYWPYYTQPINADRPPFDIKPGHNDIDGWYVYLTYNHYFDRDNRLSLGYDFMEKRGSRVRVDYNYAAGTAARGYLKGFYQYDRIKDAANEPPHRWEISANHNQQFDTNNRAGLSIYSFSDVGLGQDLVSEMKDVFRQKYDAYYNSNINGHAISLSVSDTEEINTSTAKYETKERTLPNLTYSLPSQNLFSKFYYNHGFAFSRNYSAALSDKGYGQTGSFTPRLSLGGLTFMGASLSANAGLSTTYSDYEADSENARFINNINTSETLNIDIIPGGILRGSASHSFARKLNYLEQGSDGITSNLINVSLSAGLFGINAGMSTSYNMLIKQSELPDGADLGRFAPVSINGSFGSGSYYFSASSSYNILANRVKSTSLSFRLDDPMPSKLWSVAASTNYVNNTIDGSGRLLEAPGRDSVTFATTIKVPVGRDFDFYFSREYDLMEKNVTTQAYTVAWRVHCWSVDFSWSKRNGGIETINFSVFIRDIPGARFDKPVTAIPDYSQYLGI